MADKKRYNEILADPTDSTAESIAELIKQYPYTQPLRFLLAQKQFEAGSSDMLSEALLYTPAHHWLYDRIKNPPLVDLTEPEFTERAIDTETVTETILPPPAFQIDDPEAEAADAIIQHEGNSVNADEDPQAPAQSVEDVAPAPIAAQETKPSAIDELPDHPAAVDYLAYDDALTERPAASEQFETEEPNEIVPLSQGTPHEKISLYDDDHMPYSFLWWLNKTRMEFAHTYRPYAPRRASTRGSDQEKQLLDQQIRENIFHLQSPEEKLSEPYQAKTVSFQVPKKIDPVIERFIREEPQIKPPQPDKIDLENKARQSAEDQLTLVTETLAKIYEDQGLYPKAIAVYKKLSLKYPEKSAYFAGLIDTLENKLT